MAPQELRLEAHYELHHITDEAGNDEAEFARRWKILEDGLLAIKRKMPSAVGGGSARATHTSTDTLRRRKRSARPPAPAPAPAPVSAPASSRYATITISSDDAPDLLNGGLNDGGSSSDWLNGGGSSSS